MRLSILVSLSIALMACGGSSSQSSSSPESAARQADPARIVAAAAACGNPAPTTPLTPSCQVLANPDGFEPQCNPHLAQDAWSASHRANAAQASSPLPGIRDATQVNIDHISLTAAPNNLNFTEPDAAGRQAMWASTVGFTGEIVKVDSASLNLIDRFFPEGAGSLSASGAYNLLDRDQHLIVGQADSLQVYGDSEVGNRHSGIRQLSNFVLPAEARCGTRADELVGITMLPDGHVAFATKFGMVGVVPRQPEAMCAASTRVFSINGDNCSDASIADEALEQVSNSIAADEASNIYVVSSAAQYRINWDGDVLSPGWRAAYSGAGGSGGGRLGSGSGSTPSLMGLSTDRDRFVVITDGQPLMHLVLMWKDDIPSDWTPIKPGLDRRIACEIPVNFGDDNATVSLSEQSVLVRGYASVIVNNQLGLNSLLALVPSQAQPFTQLTSGLSINRPRGLERIDWNPLTRQCQRVWSNPNVSIPNGIPSMSASSNQIFGVGSRTLMGLDWWTLEGVDFASGESTFSLPASPYPTDNSFYAATVIGPGESVWTGTFGGLTRYRACALNESCGRTALNPLQHLPLAELLPYLQSFAP